jgi:hypothetical protein
LDPVSLAHWDQDDEYELPGAHCFVREGYTSVINALSQEMDIRLCSIVKQVDYSADKIRITTWKNEETFPPNPVTVQNKDIAEKYTPTMKQSTQTIYEADAVLVTVPLGVLQQNMIEFTPSLPEWKTRSLSRLGFGLLNKLVMTFPRVFWEDNLDYFGSMNSDPDERGDCYLFWNLYPCVTEPVLVGLIAGKAAFAVEKQSLDEVLERTMKRLRKIFGQDIPDPVRYIKTNWNTDIFSTGSYSYIRAGGNGNDYDNLAKDVQDRIYFAGEATCRQHPATVLGALLSGLKAAGNIDMVHTNKKEKMYEPEPSSSPRKRKVDFDEHDHFRPESSERVSHIHKRRRSMDPRAIDVKADGIETDETPNEESLKFKIMKKTKETIESTIDSHGYHKYGNGNTVTSSAPQEQRRPVINKTRSMGVATPIKTNHTTPPPPQNRLYMYDPYTVPTYQPSNKIVQEKGYLSTTIPLVYNYQAPPTKEYKPLFTFTPAPVHNGVVPRQPPLPPRPAFNIALAPKQPPLPVLHSKVVPPPKPTIPKEEIVSLITPSPEKDKDIDQYFNLSHSPQQDVPDDKSTTSTCEVNSPSALSVSSGAQSPGSSVIMDRAAAKKVIAKVVCKKLANYYAKGQIGNSSSYKHLARKLTKLLLEKEGKKCNYNYVINSHVKRKIGAFVKDYFNKLSLPYVIK